MHAHVYMHVCVVLVCVGRVHLCTCYMALFSVDVAIQRRGYLFCHGFFL